MPHAACFGKRGTISGPQDCLSRVLDECQLAFKDVDEFVFMAVPVPLARPFARWKRHQVDAEDRELPGVAESLAGASGTGFVEGFRVASSNTHWHGGNVNFRHRVFVAFTSNLTSSRSVEAHANMVSLQSR